MTRLFIRFYVGVLFILTTAWYIQTYVYQARSDAENIQVIEQALGGGVRLAIARLQSAEPADHTAVLAKVQQHFDFPVSLIEPGQVPDYAEARLKAGHDVVFIARQEDIFLLGRLADGSRTVQFGPLPKFGGPNETELALGLGLVLLLAAAAIALLLRPVARQFRLIENAAGRIAGGDFSARVDEITITSTATLARAFNNMAERTETMLRTQRELLQAVSHELRTPLSRIHFAIDLIRDSEEADQREERLRSLESAAEDLDGLVGELLQYVRMETSEPLLQVSQVSLPEVATTVIEKSSLLHSATQFSLGPGLQNQDLTVSADAAALERAVGNLVANAARYGRSRVVIDATQQADQTIIDVDDDGPGIPEPQRQRAFDPFVRLHDGGRGAGLGLALVHRIAVRHGGRTEILDSPLGGCRVRTYWPHHN